MQLDASLRVKKAIDDVITELLLNKMTTSSTKETIDDLETGLKTQINEAEESLEFCVTVKMKLLVGEGKLDKDNLDWSHTEREENDASHAEIINHIVTLNGLIDTLEESIDD